MKALAWAFAAMLCIAPMSMAQEPFDATQAIQGDLEIIGAGICPGNIEVAKIKNDAGPFIFYFAEVNNRIIIIQFTPDGQKQVLFVFGEVVKSADGKFIVKVLFTMTPDEAKAKFPGPCDYLSGVQA